MKILVCQISPKTGALENNAAIMEKYYRKAQKDKADICVFPELAITGYLAEDLFLNPNFIHDTQDHIDKLVKITSNTCLLIPAPIMKNGLLYNAVIAAKNGKIIGTTYKNELPNYGIFDENRYFTSGKSKIITINGLKIGIPICEDIWLNSVCNKLKELGAEIFISINASPFETNKMTKRVQQIKHIFNNTKIPIIYCNQVAAQDGIIFDGKSCLFDGKLNIIGKSFEKDIKLVEFRKNKLYTNISYSLSVNYNEEIYKAIILGTRSYIKENGFSKVILGLSGGLDSAMVAQIAVDAIGADNVSAIMLPSKFTSKESINDAQKVADCLNICLKTIAINSAVDCIAHLANIDELSLAHQNLQSRIRGTILMAEANKTNALLLTTGNKSELATGYATIYGDMNGGFNPIKDLYKTDLYELARYKNIIPQHIIDKAPSAELKPNQKDSDSLPEYNILDQILKQHIEHNKGSTELLKEFEPSIVKKILRLVKNSEFKRKQSAIGVKISSKSFEKDRRIPITNHYI